MIKETSNEQSALQSIHNIGSVYSNFYHIINQMRSSMIMIVQHPYQFVSNDINKCLVANESEAKLKDISDVVKKLCNLSHRKYAEVYYFFRYFLIRKKI